MEFHHPFPVTDNFNRVYIAAAEDCIKRRNEFLTPEHIILQIWEQEPFQGVLVEEFEKEERDAVIEQIRRYVDSLESVPEGCEYQFTASDGLNRLEGLLYSHQQSSSTKEVDIPHLIYALGDLHDLYGPSLFNGLINSHGGHVFSDIMEAYSCKIDNEEDDYDDWVYDEYDGMPGGRGKSWKEWVVCVNDDLEGRNPLIGREAELARTIQVLCRKDKNNPLHVGEPGVGKTALVYGLARKIAEGNVPKRLKGAKIYKLDMGTLTAGAQYRGQFEDRLKSILDGLKSEPGSILYIDEIHTIVGAGANVDHGVDASNMMKPYLESGAIRFIGSTTYEEYNRQFSKSKSLVRRFQQIDITEPTEGEAIEILSQLKPVYEKFHRIRYTAKAVEFAVRGTVRHLPDRRLPDKAIDLLDEAGAYLELNREEVGKNFVDKALMEKVLARICRVESETVAEKDEAEQMRTLTDRVLGRVFGQDEAVRGVTEAVMMSKAGLTDPEKPVASMLFVGPTGVGKTEVAVALAEAMGVPLVRFDMSEYVEKHTVAKLIGAPAGYVGYDDGGLLTDAIRKNPRCVLLLDEIEKAHSDIYNILLQVMDYGRLTDNKGRLSDFRNVVIIMTSNAGAQFASRASVGFGSNVTAADAMAREVKRLFKPEFLGRLSAMISFNSLDREMAGRILDKKLRILSALLEAKKVTFHLSDEARDSILKEGVTADKGARELDRVITGNLKPLLMREILFGQLKNGGEATVTLSPEGQLTLTAVGAPETPLADGEELPEEEDWPEEEELPEEPAPTEKKRAPRRKRRPDTWENELPF